MKRSLSVLLAVSLLSVIAESQQAEPPKPNTPPTSPPTSSGHKWLKKFVGEWTCTNQGIGAAESESVTGTGSMSSRMIGDYWVVNEMKGDMGGFTFTGLQTIGYDAKKQKFTATWIDSVMDYRWIYEGTLDEKENKIVFDAEGPSFTGDGTTGQYRDIYEFKSDDDIIVLSQGKNSEGKWITFMSGEMRRKPEKAGDPSPKSSPSSESHETK